jgi:hypothetical protein
MHSAKATVDREFADPSAFGVPPDDGPTLQAAARAATAATAIPATAVRAVRILLLRFIGTPFGWSERSASPV